MAAFTPRYATDVQASMTFTLPLNLSQAGSRVKPGFRPISLLAKARPFALSLAAFTFTMQRAVAHLLYSPCIYFFQLYY